MSDGVDEDGIGKDFDSLNIKTLTVENIDIPGTEDNDIGTIKLSDNLEIAGDGLILHDLDDYDFSTANIINGSTSIIYEPNFNNASIVDGVTTITYSDDSTALATYLSITTLTSSVSKTISDVENSTINNETYAITQSGTTITLDTPAKATYSSARIITSSVSKTITSEENIIINGRPYTITQSGTIITLVDTLKKIISLEAGNLVIATYQSDGTRIDKEIIMDTNNSISEIANAAFDLKIKSLDVTKTDSINDPVEAPSEGSARIDGFIINTPQTINVGGSGITVTNTSYTTAPTSSIVYLKATDDSNGSAVTYIWTLDDFTGTSGQMFNIFFNNSADTNVNLKITFGTNGLVTGNGLNDALTFSSQGQSASLVYIDSLWCIINTGAAVS